MADFEQLNTSEYGNSNEMENFHGEVQPAGFFVRSDVDLLPERIQDYEDIDSFDQPINSSLAVTRDFDSRPAPTALVSAALSVDLNSHEEDRLGFSGEKLNEIAVGASSKCTVQFPLKPSVLLPTHFIVTICNENVEHCRLVMLNKINNFLKSVKGFDFQYFESQKIWCGKHICSSAYSEVQVQLYEEEEDSFCSCHEFIVELVKYYGDSKPFFQFFRQFKASLTADSLVDGTTISYSHKIRDPSCNNFPGLISDAPLPSIPHVEKDQFLRGIAPIFLMSNVPYVETRLEALKMIGEFAKLPQEYIQHDSCCTKCIDLLDKHILDENDYVKQLAIAVYASLLPSLLNQMLTFSHAIPCFFQLLLRIDRKDAFTFETVQILRDCAKILVTIGKNNSEELYNKLIDTHVEDAELINQFLNMRTQDIPDEYLSKEIETLISILKQKQPAFPILKEKQSISSPLSA